MSMDASCCRGTEESALDTCSMRAGGRGGGASPAPSRGLFDRLLDAFCFGDPADISAIARTTCPGNDAPANSSDGEEGWYPGTDWSRGGSCGHPLGGYMWGSYGASPYMPRLSGGYNPASRLPGGNEPLELPAVRFGIAVPGAAVGDAAGAPDAAVVGVGAAVAPGTGGLAPGFASDFSASSTATAARRLRPDKSLGGFASSASGLGSLFGTTGQSMGFGGGCSGANGGSRTGITSAFCEDDVACKNSKGGWGLMATAAGGTAGPSAGSTVPAGFD